MCNYRPFQVVPYSHDDPVTSFTYSGPSVKKFVHCSLAASTKARVKFPDNTTEIEMQWFNKCFVGFTVSGTTLSFKVRNLLMCKLFFYSWYR